jgi:virginiamycin A acetyltransferase
LLIRFKELGPSVKTKGDIHIGSDVWIGYGSIILSGVTIGNGAVIGTGSVVTKDIPSYAVAAGNPARVIRSRFSPKVVQEMLDLKWWELPWNELRKKIPWLLSEIEKP